MLPDIFAKPYIVSKHVTTILSDALTRHPDCISMVPNFYPGGYFCRISILTCELDIVFLRTLSSSVL